MSGPSLELYHQLTKEKRTTINGQLEGKGSRMLPFICGISRRLCSSDGAFFPSIPGYICRMGYFKSLVAPLLSLLSLYFLLSLYSIRNMLQWLPHLELIL